MNAMSLRPMQVTASLNVEGLKAYLPMVGHRVYSSFKLSYLIFMSISPFLKHFWVYLSCKNAQN